MSNLSIVSKYNFFSTTKLHMMLLQAHLGDIMGLVLDNCSKLDIALKCHMKFFISYVYKNYIYTALYILKCGMLPSLKKCTSVQFSCSVVSNSLRCHESQHTRPPCPSPSPGVHSDSHPSSLWCHPAISSWVVPFSSCLQSFPASYVGDILWCLSPKEIQGGNSCLPLG